MQSEPRLESVRCYAEKGKFILPMLEDCAEQQHISQLANSAIENHFWVDSADQKLKDSVQVSDHVLNRPVLVTIICKQRIV